jgi:Kef-type K+ transport system membrane component KefB
VGDLATATILAALVLIAAVVSVEFGVSVAIIEITLGVVAANLFGIGSTPWIDFVGTFAGIVLTFLAGAEVDPALLRREWKPAVLIGGLSFLPPFVGVGLFARYVAGWSVPQSEIAGIALSTTSLAVVYAVLVETGLTASELGKILMAATFVTDLGTALALSVLFIQPLMSTGLTFGTISSLYGLNAGIINRQQFTVLLGAVIGSAVIPTLIAQRGFAPPVHPLTSAEVEAIEDEEFEPSRGHLR